MAHFNCLLTIAVLSFVSTSDAFCNNPFHEVGSACLLVNSKDKMNWTQARDYCKSLSYSIDPTDLAVVTNCQDLNPIWQYLLLDHVLDEYWLGGYDIEQEGVWHWVSSKLVNMGVPFWPANIPDGGPNENCLMLTAAGFFDDADCSEEKHVICSPHSQSPSERQGSARPPTTRHT
ncbi:C-type lectin mosGCTL-7-like isoform X1 [Panulirus ornatus]|uniref:C-type lectin mosGCTL-7-like isoform X1 n=1 Tax=Panulirus ornatus TaxID=150431 RepID=UPI003A890DA9